MKHMSKKLTITIHVNPAAAVRAGKALCGACEVVLSEQDLAQLTPDQRETLAKHVAREGIYGYSLGDEHTADASIEELARLLDALEAEVQQRAQKEREDEAEKRARNDAELREAMVPRTVTRGLNSQGQWHDPTSSQSLLTVDVLTVGEFSFKWCGPLSEGLREQYEAAQAEAEAEAERLRQEALPRLQAILAEREAEEAARQAKYDEQYARLPEALRARHKAGYAKANEIDDALQALWRADAGLGDGCVAPDDWYDEAEPKTLTDEQFAALQALRKRLPEGFEAAPLYIYPERAYRAATEDDDPGDVDSDGEVRIPDSERERQLVAVVTWQRCDCDVRVVLPLES